MNDEHSRYEENIGSYLLGSLPADETAAFEVHLAICERCSREVEMLRTAVDILPETVEQLEPPQGLRKRIMAEVRNDTELAEVKISAPRYGSRFKFALRPALAIGFVAICIGVFAGYLLGAGTNEGGSSVTTIQAEAAPGSQSARADVVIDGDKATIDVSNLPVQSKDRVYQAWLREGNKMLPSTVFVVGKDGKGAAVIPHGMEDAEEVLVTLEPDGGSVAPTAPPVLRATV